MKYNINITENEDLMGKNAARAILNEIIKLNKRKKEIVVLFASAPSQHATWKWLKMFWKKLGLRLQKEIANKIVAFHMDEYLGLNKKSKQLFGNVLKKNLFAPLGFNKKNIFYFDSDVKNLKKNIKKIEDKYKKYSKFDIVLGGIGKLPHVAFNDPPEAKFNEKKIVKIVNLPEESRIQQVIDKEFEKLEDVPKTAITFSLKPIFDARKIFIMIPRKFKAESVRKMLDEKISEKIPASGLRMKNVVRKVSFFIDKDAASLSKVARKYF